MQTDVGQSIQGVADTCLVTTARRLDPGVDSLCGVAIHVRRVRDSDVLRVITDNGVGGWSADRGHTESGALMH